MRNRLCERFVWLLALVCLLSFAWTPTIARAEADSADPYADAVQTTLNDGTYLVDVTLEGGTGRATVSSPATMEIRNARAVVTLVWSSSHYDYMLVAGKRYLPTNQDGNSTFVVPVLSLDEPYDVVADTTAMSEPHEIDYTLALNAASIQPNGSASTLPLAAIAAGAAGVALCVFVVRQRASHQ